MAEEKSRDIPQGALGVRQDYEMILREIEAVSVSVVPVHHRGYLEFRLTVATGFGRENEHHASDVVPFDDFLSRYDQITDYVLARLKKNLHEQITRALGPPRLVPVDPMDAVRCPAGGYCDPNAEGVCQKCFILRRRPE